MPFIGDCGDHTTDMQLLLSAAFEKNEYWDDISFGSPSPENVATVVVGVLVATAAAVQLYELEEDGE